MKLRVSANCVTVGSEEVFQRCGSQLSLGRAVAFMANSGGLCTQLPHEMLKTLHFIPYSVSVR